MWLVTIPIIIVLAVVLFEYRLRRPDQLILFESNGKIGFRSARWYPRHFSLALPGTTYLVESKVEATAKGSIAVIVRLATTVAASQQSIASLIRTGGWDVDAVSRAGKELERTLQAYTREFTDRHAIEELSSERIYNHLTQHAAQAGEKFGLEVISLTVTSVDPVDASIADAIRQRESARILEQTELLNQNARVASVQAKLHADEQIAALEHELSLKKLDLKQSELEKESVLARRRVEDDIARNTLKLKFDREEMELVKENPQLLLLTPQMARLAEASQNLRNARTVVSLSPNDADQGSRLMSMLQLFLQNMLDGFPQSSKKKKESS